MQTLVSNIYILYVSCIVYAIHNCSLCLEYIDKSVRTTKLYPKFQHFNNNIYMFYAAVHIHCVWSLI